MNQLSVPDARVPLDDVSPDDALEMIRPDLDRLLARHTRRCFEMTGELPAHVAFQTDAGYVTIVEFYASGESIFVWRGLAFVGKLDRTQLCLWLADTDLAMSLYAGAIALRSSPVGGITITVPGITDAPISRHRVAILRQKLTRHRR